MMGDHKTAKTGQSRLKDYMAAREQDTQTLSPTSTKREQLSQIMLDTTAKHVAVEKEGQGISIHSKSVRRTNKRFLLMSGLLCLAVLLIVGGLFVWMRVRALPSGVTLYQVGTQGFTADIGGGGIVYPIQQENISYPIAERALSVLVAPGDHVTANQPLIRLDMAVLNAQLEQAKKDVVSSSTYLATVKANGNTVAIAQAQQLYTLAVDKYDALEAEASSSTLHNGTVISPISGIVTSLYIAPGEIFAANRTMIVIMDESAVIVRTEIPLTYLTQVQLGQ